MAETVTTACLAKLDPKEIEDRMERKASQDRREQTEKRETQVLQE